ncbi:MAG: DMT family transporter [Anaerolineaceae bacterium]|nr:DMT family transporter [Anaerolineaceae bacterium]
MKNKSIGLILMLTSGLTFAIATILIRSIQTYTTITAANIAAIRFIIATPIMWLLFFKTGIKPLANRKRLQFILLGFVFSVASFSAVFAIDRISSSLFVIILFTYPSLVVIYSVLAKKPIPWLTPLALPLSLIGLVLAVSPFNGGLKIDTLGFLITLLNSVALASYFILSSRLFEKQDSRMQGSLWVFIGSLIIGILVIPFASFRLPANPLEWWLIIGYATLGTIIPIVTANVGINLLGAAQASMTNVIQPIATVLLSVLIFSDVMNFSQILGSILVIGSVIVLQIYKRKTDNNPPKSTKFDPEQVNYEERTS